MMGGEIIIGLDDESMMGGEIIIGFDFEIDRLLFIVSTSSCFLAAIFVSFMNNVNSFYKRQIYNQLRRFDNLYLPC